MKGPAQVIHQLLQEDLTTPAHVLMASLGKTVQVSKFSFSYVKCSIYIFRNNKVMEIANGLEPKNLVMIKINELPCCVTIVLFAPLMRLYL